MSGAERRDSRIWGRARELDFVGLRILKIKRRTEGAAELQRVPVSHES